MNKEKTGDIEIRSWSIGIYSDCLLSRQRLVVAGTGTGIKALEEQALDSSLVVEFWSSSVLESSGNQRHFIRRPGVEMPQCLPSDSISVLAKIGFEHFLNYFDGNSNCLANNFGRHFVLSQ